MAKKDLNQNHQRVPRPMGITQLMNEYHKTNDKKLLDMVQTFIIQQWIINNGRVCGNNFSILELSKFLLCEPERIRRRMMEMLVETNLWDKEKQDKLMDSLIGQNLVWLLEDRMEIEGQLSLLKKSQGNRYTPFVTSEVNKTLSLKLNTSTNLQSFIRALSGGNSYVNIFNNNQVNQTQNNTITYDDALKIVQEESTKFLGSDKELKYIEANYDIDDLPEVVATKQLGVDTSKEGLTLSNSEISQTIDTYYKELDNGETPHDVRREIELQIDKEAIDPEIDIYPDN